MLQNTAAAKFTYSLKTTADYKGKILENNLTGLVMLVNEQEVHFKWRPRSLLNPIRPEALGIAPILSNEKKGPKPFQV